MPYYSSINLCYPGAFALPTTEPVAYEQRYRVPLSSGTTPPPFCPLNLSLTTGLSQVSWTPLPQPAGVDPLCVSTPDYLLRTVAPPTFSGGATRLGPCAQSLMQTQPVHRRATIQSPKTFRLRPKLASRAHHP